MEILRTSSAAAPATTWAPGGVIRLTSTAPRTAPYQPRPPAGCRYPGPAFVRGGEHMVDLADAPHVRQRGHLVNDHLRRGGPPRRLA